MKAGSRDNRRDAAIAVTGLGMVSALGRDVVTACAAARAGIMRAVPLPLEVLDDASLVMEPVVGCAVAGFTDGFTKFGRLARMGAAALSDLVSYSGAPEAFFHRTGILLQLRDGHYEDVHFTRNLNGDADFRGEVVPARQQEVEQYRRRIADTLIPRIYDLNGMPSMPPVQRCTFGGAAAFVENLIAASELLSEGRLDACIVGGIDSLTETEILEQLSDLGVLNAPDQSQGFIPGEAAAFVMLERLGKAEARGARIEAVLDSPSTSSGSDSRFSDEPPSGRDLSLAISSTLANASKPAPGRWVGIGNLNGDAWRALHFGNALMHLQARGVPTEFEHLFPAASFGETGAAAGAVSTCVGVRGLARGYIREGAALVWLTSDDGAHGAFFLRNDLD